jgi:hypothetical protein
MNGLKRGVEEQKYKIDINIVELNGVIDELKSKKARLSEERAKLVNAFDNLNREQIACNHSRGKYAKLTLCELLTRECRGYGTAFVAMGALLGGIFAYITLLIPGMDPALATAIVIGGFIVFFILAETAFRGVMTNLLKIEPLSSNAPDEVRRAVIFLGLLFISLFIFLMITRFAIGSDILFLVFQVATEVVCLATAGAFFALRRYWQYPLILSEKLTEAQTKMVTNASEMKAADDALTTEETKLEFAKSQLTELDAQVKQIHQAQVAASASPSVSKQLPVAKSAVAQHELSFQTKDS